jgi:dTDP-4-dehydrorhamnose reductase
MVVLITGSSGTLGRELVKKIPSALKPTHSELDITDYQAVLNYFDNHSEIDTVIHTAAMTGIRECEINKISAMNINVIGTRNIVDVIQKTKKNIFLNYISTACVFDGHNEMYNEESIPYPENFYALTKLLGEYEVKKLGEKLIIRTNFVGKTQWPYPKAFEDRFGTYLFADDVAEGIIDVHEEKLEGIVHIVGNKKMSMLDLARITTPKIESMTMEDYSGPQLTKDMSLDTIVWKKYNISHV